MTRLVAITLGMSAVLLCSLPVRAEVPYTLSYQGFLTDAVGNPVTGEWTITFSFHHQKTGGEAFHQETVDVVTQLGLFSVLLGEDGGNAIDLAEFSGGDAYLELSIETDVGPVVLKPRQQIVSNPFAFHASAAALADDAGKLGGKEPSAFVTVEKAGDVCVTPGTLGAQVEALGFFPGPHYTDADVAAYLEKSGFGACQCYGDDQVAAYLLAAGYVPGPHFSGKYADLAGTPDLAVYLKQTDLEGKLAAMGVLLADGSVPVSGNLNFMGKQAVNLVVHNAKSAPANPVAGQLWWETGAKLLKVWDGTQWAQAGGGGTAMDVSCPGCVDAADVSFPFAAGSDKGGAALSALDLSCKGCVAADEVGFSWAKGVLPGGDAEHALTADTATNALTANQAANVTCASCVQIGEIDPAAMAGKYVSYDPAQSQLGVNTVQKAIDKLAIAGAGSFQEGNGTIVPYVEQWGLPAYGEATTYVHMMNPSQPKVLMHLYAGESSGFATSNNLVVAYQFAPNQYSADVNGNAGETALQVGNPSIFNSGSHLLIHQTVGTGGNGAGAGNWELNQVVSVQGSTLQLVKPLMNTYKSCGDNCGRAQAVVAASYNQLEIVNGGTLKPAQDLDGSGNMGGIVYIRAQKIVVKNGGKIVADGAGFYGASTGASCEYAGCGYPGDSHCNTGANSASTAANCTGGGGARVNACYWQGGSYCNNASTGGGGGGNKTAGDAGSQGWSNYSGGGAGGAALAGGDTKLYFGGGGGGAWDGWCENGRAGDGGGIVVLGATTIIIEKGAIVTANGLYGSPQSNCTSSPFPVTGSGAGGTVALFADQFVVDGTVTATGGPTHDGNKGTFGGKGGDGWTLQKPTVAGVVNESYAKGVEIWVDDNNVTPSVGDPNSKGAPSWDGTNKKWGADGLAAWSTGPLNLTSVVPWTLGEHAIKFKETGGAGGDIKMFLYVIYPFTKSVPPTNDTCDQPVLLDLKAGSATVSGTTEDVMGKTKATDANQGPFCGGSGGPDVVYGFTLTEWRQLAIKVTTAFTPRVYVKKDKCLDGDVMACGQASIQTPVLAPATYYLFVDGDGNLQKGDFKLTVTATPPGPPPNDTCAGAEQMNFQNGTAKASGMTLFATNKHSAACGGADASETVYKFDVPPGTTGLSIQVDADFAPVIYLVKGDCAQAPIACIPTNTYSMNWPTSGTYYLFVDGKTAADKGLYTATVTVK